MLSSILISKVGKRAGLAIARVLTYLLPVLAVAFIGWWIHGKGYDHGVSATELKYQTAIEEERERQIDANDAALQAALEKQQRLELTLAVRDAEIERILSEGSEDPDVDRRALSSDSVRRINRIR